jgi:hypothetical protein
MPHRRSRAEETRSTTTRGEAISIHHVDADEATHCSRDNEKIIGEVHIPMID